RSHWHSSSRTMLPARRICWERSWHADETGVLAFQTGGYMRTIGITIAFSLLTGLALAQPKAPPPTKLYSPAADIQAMIAKAKASRKENQPNVTDRILTLAPYNAGLEYRASVGPAAVHEKEAEMFYVIDGSGTLVTGGKLTAETRPNPENLSGTGIEGGKS